MIDQVVTDKEVKVEKALLDLNELKTQMYQEQQTASAYKDNTQPKKMNTQTNNFFRETAYSSKPMMRPFSGAGNTQTSFFSTNTNFNPAGSLT